MPKEKKYLLSEDSMLNADDAPFAISPNSWVNMENCRTGSTDKGVTGTVESIGGTLLLSTPQPSITFLTIGVVEDTENSRFVYFKKCTTAPWDKIVCYYAGSVNTEYDILLSSQVVGGLNFDRNSLIHSAKIVNGYLYWVDGTNNQPRKINIEAAIKANYPSFQTSEVAYNYPIDFKEITLIKPPPALAPNISKDYDSTFDNNFIANDSFEFAFQYTWYDNEVTVVGTYSPASRLNFATDNFNRIIVSMDSFESIPDTVRIVSLIVRFGNENNAKVVKTWDKEVASELAEIQDQNSGAQVLIFNFYNNITGATLAPDDVLRPFDSVPLYSKTMEAFKNRIGLANNIEGYDTPSITSLAISLGTQITLSSTTQTTNLIGFRHRFRLPLFSDGYAYTGDYVYLDFISPVGYYLINGTDTTTTGPYPNTYPPFPPDPTTVAFTGLTFKGTNINEVITNTRPPGFIMTNERIIEVSSATLTITGVITSSYNVMAQKSPYKAGVTFYDFAMRKCGVVTNDGIIVSTPNRDYAYSTAVSGINWSLSNVDAVNEIPDWAYYYCPVRTLNLRTRFFIQSSTNAAKYATRDVNGVNQFTSDVFVTGSVGIGLNTTAIIQSGLGYVFNQGDICILIKSDNTVYELPVVGQDGNYILIKPQDIGNLSGVSFVFEIYTPYQSGSQEPYFETGQMYRVLSPGTINRQYETLNGVFSSDTYVLTRSYNAVTYFAGSMSPNDLFYKRWDNDGGKVNFITNLGQAIKTQYMSWSDVFIPNTAINGLSTFRALNQKPVPEDCGAIQKLVLTSKVQSEGTVMLSICTIETNSMYLSETQITDSTGATQFFSSSDNVIGTINTLKGSFGTINPESVVEYRGNVFFYSAITGKYVQYAVNGLYPISNFKMTRFWNLFSLQYQSMTIAEIEALGSRPFVFSTVDPNHNELLISVPKLLETPPKGYLPDYQNTVYPFDIYDGQGKTIVYKLDVGTGNPKWLGSYAFNPEYFITLQNKLYSFLYGHLYLHNQSNYNEFYGVRYSSKVMIVSNADRSNPKVYDNVAIESNLVPSFVYMYNDYPYQQSSDLVDLDFRDLEGLFYSTIKRNKLLPTSNGYTTSGLLTGEKMRNTAMFFMIEWRISDTPLELKFINIGYTIGRGQPV